MSVKLTIVGDFQELDEIENEILELNDPDDEAPISTSLTEIDGTLDWELDVYVFSDDQREAAAALIRKLAEPAVVEVPNFNWVAEVQKQLKPIHVGEVFIYGSHDRDLDRPGSIHLEIDAGQAFGTGSHATTQGCLALMQDLAKELTPGRTLDLGTGTGVLALVAAKLWDTPVLATDIDPVSVETAKENAAKNGIVGPQLDFACADGLDHAVFQGAKFDLVIANILAQPLIDLAVGIDAIASEKGRLILSGLLKTQEPGVAAAYEKLGWQIAEEAPIGDWQAILLVR